MKFYSRVFCFCFQLFYDELFFVFFCTSLLSKEVWLLLGRPIRWTLVFHFFVHQVTRCTRSQVPFFPLLHFYKKTHAEPRPFFKLLCLHIGFVRIGKAYIQLSFPISWTHLSIRPSSFGSSGKRVLMCCGFCFHCFRALCRCLAGSVQAVFRCCSAGSEFTLVSDGILTDWWSSQMYPGLDHHPAVKNKSCWKEAAHSKAPQLVASFFSLQSWTKY